MGSTVLYEDSDTFDDGSRYEMIATSVPESDDYPEGVKYRFQYMDEDGRTLLRFDNLRRGRRTPRQVITMPDKPTSDRSDDTREIEMDDIESETGFLEDRDPRDYPSVLRITSNSEHQHRQRALDRIERWEAGKEVPHVINFQNPSDLRALLTDRRIELLRSIMADRPESIRGLAKRLERDVKSVHDDLQVLAEYDIVHFEEAGRAKEPFIPYDTIEVNLEITRTGAVDDTAPA